MVNLKGLIFPIQAVLLSTVLYYQAKTLRRFKFQRVAPSVSSSSVPISSILVHKIHENGILELIQQFIEVKVPIPYPAAALNREYVFYFDPDSKQIISHSLSALTSRSVIVCPAGVTPYQILVCSTGRTVVVIDMNHRIHWAVDGAWVNTRGLRHLWPRNTAVLSQNGKRLVYRTLPSSRGLEIAKFLSLSYSRWIVFVLNMQIALRRRRLVFLLWALMWLFLAGLLYQDVFTIVDIHEDLSFSVEHSACRGNSLEHMQAYADLKKAFFLLSGPIDHSFFSNLICYIIGLRLTSIGGGRSFGIFNRNKIYSSNGTTHVDEGQILVVSSDATKAGIIRKRLKGSYYLHLF